MSPAAPLSTTDRSLAIFSEDQDLFGLERAKKLSYICSKSDSGGTGADEEVAASLADTVIEDEQEAKG